MFFLPHWVKSLFSPRRLHAAAPVDAPPHGPRAHQPMAMAEQDSEKATATADPEEPRQKPQPRGGATTKPRPKKPPHKQLPPYKVLLHNDSKNTFEHVILTLIELTPLDVNRATQVTFEADKTGVALVLVTHKERAELYVDQFRSKSLTVTVEPAE